MYKLITVESRFKVRYLVIKMVLHIKKYRYRVKSQFMESKCADRGHSLNRDCIVLFSLKAGKAASNLIFSDIRL